jgi:protein involved in sex pheromone biosynthesis
LYKELSPAELSKYYIQYQVASTAELTRINGSDLVTRINGSDLDDGWLNISHNSCDSDIYLMLYNNDGLLLDTEVIDAVDYSKIKGKDHSGITFDINDQINIPKNKANDG